MKVKKKASEQLKIVLKMHDQGDCIDTPPPSSLGEANTSHKGHIRSAWLIAAVKRLQRCMGQQSCQLIAWQGAFSSWSVCHHSTGSQASRLAGTCMKRQAPRERLRERARAAGSRSEEGAGLARKRLRDMVGKMAFLSRLQNPTFWGRSGCCSCLCACMHTHAQSLGPQPRRLLANATVKRPGMCGDGRCSFRWAHEWQEPLRERQMLCIRGGVEATGSWQSWQLQQCSA